MTAAQSNPASGDFAWHDGRLTTAFRRSAVNNDRETRKICFK
jgi:hypothetical protein